MKSVFGQPAHKSLWNLGLQTVRALETDQGILASAKTEVYGCIFGRDSLITSLKLLEVYKKTRNEDALRIVKKSLTTLAQLQGSQVNIESGEEPGKMIHEYRPDNHEHLTRDLATPWFVYPDNVMRSYDTIDATPLFLITAYRYWQASGDQPDIASVKRALDWLLFYGDSNNDGFIDYGLKPQRQYGGLQNQNWMDSVESTFHEDGSPVRYPLAPVEAQAYAYLALVLWSRYFSDADPQHAEILALKGRTLKELFREKFVIEYPQGYTIASYIDADGKPITSIRSSVGHTLWAAMNKADDGVIDGILPTEIVASVVRRLMAEDIFEPKAGLRTLGKFSRQFNALSYHNGSIWPHDNSLVAQGMEQYGFVKQARCIRRAYLYGIAHFQTPIELFTYDQGLFREWVSADGQTSCKQQAWSAASVLADTMKTDRSLTPFQIRKRLRDVLGFFF